ncbi:DUF397 domain-containing protein [Kitasatospora sp. NPDC005751]|uniref:DUF397 domain-containing protein n=1 Tax=Kitasatospora sp. NPDC005751 TaxID=3157064 RepID=UPI0033C5E03C
MSKAELAWFKSSHSTNEGAACIEVAWQKSSYSSNEGGQCVEVAWQKSSHSGNEGANCVEVASMPGTVHVRDSKDRSGPQLAFEPAAWQAFVEFAAASSL